MYNVDKINKVVILRVFVELKLGRKEYKMERCCLRNYYVISVYGIDNFEN